MNKRNIRIHGFSEEKSRKVGTAIDTAIARMNERVIARSVANLKTLRFSDRELSWFRKLG